MLINKPTLQQQHAVIPDSGWDILLRKLAKNLISFRKSVSARSSLCAQSLQERSGEDVLEDQLQILWDVVMTKVGKKLWESHHLTFFQPAPLSALLVESDANPSSGSVRVSGAGKMVQERITLPIPCPFLQLLPLQHASRLWLETRRSFVLTCWEVMGHWRGPQRGL